MQHQGSVVPDLDHLNNDFVYPTHEFEVSKLFKKMKKKEVWAKTE